MDIFFPPFLSQHSEQIGLTYLKIKNTNFLPSEQRPVANTKQSNIAETTHFTNISNRRNEV